MKFSKAWTEGPGVRRGGSDSLEGPGEGRGQWVFILGASSELRVQLICLGGVGGGPRSPGPGRWAGSLLLPLTQSGDSAVKEPEVD